VRLRDDVPAVEVPAADDVPAAHGAHGLAHFDADMMVPAGGAHGRGDGFLSRG